METQECIVLDCGSGTVKAGFSSHEKPVCHLPSVIGRPRLPGVVSGMGLKDCFVGSDAYNKRGVLSLRYPIEHGIVVNWDDMELLWQHTFQNELRVEASQYPILLTEATLNPMANKEKAAEMLFESFNVPSMHIVVQTLMSLYGSGRTTGCVLESGDGVTHCIPIYEGYSLPHAILRLDMGGRDLTDYFAKLMDEKGHEFSSISDREVLGRIKEKMCYVAADLQEELEHPERLMGTYELPDGRVLDLTDERVQVPEALFNPLVVGLEQDGIHKVVYDSIMRCDMDLRRQFFKNIVLAGGNTLFPNLDNRLQEEVQSMLPEAVSVRVASQTDRRFGVWKGASIVASMGRPDMWVTREEYNEDGASVIHRKCVSC